MKIPAALALLAALAVAGCGSGSSAASPTSAPAGSTTSGDIPDTANYLSYRGQGFTVRYVEGWGIQQGPGSGVTMSDKDSAETVAVPGSRSAIAYAASDLAHLRTVAPRFHLLSRHEVQLAAGRAQYVQYRTLSEPDPVTGKRVPVIVDRYYIPGTAKIAVLTLSTPVGVDNVDAFRLIAHSFRWK
jgi:hypothetical protein